MKVSQQGLRKRDVRIGVVYAAKVSGNLCTIRINSAMMAGGWLATNLNTSRLVRIRGARRLREILEP
jgi:hypothetical protein